LFTGVPTDKVQPLLHSSRSKEHRKRLRKRVKFCATRGEKTGAPAAAAIEFRQRKARNKGNGRPVKGKRKVLKKGPAGRSEIKTTKGEKPGPAKNPGPEQSRIKSRGPQSLSEEKSWQVYRVATSATACSKGRQTRQAPAGKRRLQSEKGGERIRID